MASSDDDRIRIRPKPPRRSSGGWSKDFVSQVLKQVSKSGARASGARGARPASTFGRGRVAAGMAGRGLAGDARRVVIKSRFVVLKRAGSKAVAAHLRYIERDGVTRDGQKGQAYGADTESADLKAFEQRGKGDRHQFRFIVSPEDAVDLEDLKGFTRQLMQRMEVDLETALDWVAVDHWDTDNPHTHIVVNGHVGRAVGAKRQDLVIAPDYMAHGMRNRACEIATEWLGPRTEAEIRQSLQREVDQERLTSLDRQVLRQASLGIVDVGHAGTVKDPHRQNLLRARLQRLEAMALAERIDPYRWRLSPGMEETLAAIGERKDILRTMHRAMRGEHRELVTDPPAAVRTVGRIAAKGLHDELNDHPYLVVDGMDGRAHYLKLPAGTDLVELPIGGIVETKSAGQERAVDRNLTASTRDGIYTVDHHRTVLAGAGDADPQASVDVHVRRLEALRRGGVVERLADGVWSLPRDFAERARQFDAERSVGPAFELRSHLPIEQQVGALGATWLDRRLVEEAVAGASVGFGAQVQVALRQRVGFLQEQGLAERQGKRIVLARNLLATLRDRELASAGQALQEQVGKPWRAVQDGESATGVYRQSVQLVSGRFAMLDDGLGFSLVPWKPVIEPRLGRQLSATVRGGSATWIVGRERTIGR